MLDISTADVIYGLLVTATLMFLGFAFHHVLYTAKQSILYDDIAMYQTHIGRLEAQRYAALPVVRHLLNTLSDNDYGKLTPVIEQLLISLEQYIIAPTHYKNNLGEVQIPDLAILRLLADTWQRQAESYPDTDKGMRSTVVTNLCAQELLAVLDDNKDFKPISIAAGIRQLREARS